MKNKQILLGAMVALGSVGTLHAAPAQGNHALLPPTAQPGECYTRVYVPAKYETRTDKVLVRDGYEKIRVTPAVFDTVTERVMVKAAGEKLEVYDENGLPLPAEEKPTIRYRRNGTVEIIPNAYINTTQRVLVKEASEQVEVTPAVYETVTQRVLVKPAQTLWKPMKGRIYGAAVTRNQAGQPVTRIDNSTGEVLCLVQEPAKYRTIKKRVVKVPASTRRVRIEAQYRNVTKRIPKKLTIRKVVTEPEYKTITKRVVRQGPQETRVNVAPEYATVQRRVLLSKGAVQWMEVLCEVNVTRDNVVSIQRSLRKYGFYEGPLDGVIGRGTMNAVTNFQQSRGLVRAGITRETLRALGLDF